MAQRQWMAKRERASRVTPRKSVELEAGTA